MNYNHAGRPFASSRNLLKIEVLVLSVAGLYTFYFIPTVCFCFMLIIFFLLQNLYVNFVANYWLTCFGQSYQKALRVDPSYRPAAECLAVVLTDLGTSLKLNGNSQDGIQKYYEALKIDPHYAVISELILFLLLAIYLLNCTLQKAMFLYLYFLCNCSLHIIILALSILRWCNMTQPLIAMRRLQLRDPCMLKHIATWV